MGEKGTASAAAGALALACLVAASIPSCLPSLDPTLVAGNLCHGGVPDGFRDPSDVASGAPAEECDDGNQEDGDGCDQRCRVECPGVLDPRTLHCYVTSDAHASCGATLPGAKLLTLRSDGERDVVASLLEGRADVFLTAYTVVLNQTGQSAKVTFDAAVTSSVYDEPGLLDRTTPPDRFGCSGCYYGRNAGFWAADQKKNDVLVVNASGDFGTMHGSAQPAQAVCERPPAGDARGCSGSCPTGATSEKRLQAPGAASASTYSYFGTRTKIDQAETTCVSLGGHLLWLESEEERELVFRYFATDLALQSFTWVGLRRVNGDFTWSDGVADGSGRPYFWAGSDPSSPSPLSPTLDCAALVSTSGSYATGLLEAIPCAKLPTVTISDSQPFLCKRPSP